MNWVILLEQSFTARMPLLTATRYRASTEHSLTFRVRAMLS